MGGSTRKPEELSHIQMAIFSYGFGGFGVFLSIISMLLMTIWLISSAGGGLGYRQKDVVTASYFNWHPFLMSAGFLVFMTPASSAFEVYAPFTRETNKRIHGALQTLAVLSIAAGYIIIYDCHAVLSDHGLAQSMHSIAGYITISLVGITYLMGLILYALKCGGPWKAELKPLHKRLGLISLSLGFTTLMTGMTEKANAMTGSELVFCQVIVGLLVATVLCWSFSTAKFMDKSQRIEEKEVDFKCYAIPDHDDDKMNVLL